MYYSGFNRGHVIEDRAFRSREREQNVNPTPNGKDPFSVFALDFANKRSEENISAFTAPILTKPTLFESCFIQEKHIKKSAM